MPLASAKPNPPKPSGPPPNNNKKVYICFFNVIQKVDPTVEAVERLRQQREQRRLNQEEAKKNSI